MQISTRSSIRHLSTAASRATLRQRRRRFVAISAPTLPPVVRRAIAQSPHSVHRTRLRSMAKHPHGSLAHARLLVVVLRRLMLPFCQQTLPRARTRLAVHLKDVPPTLRPILTSLSRERRCCLHATSRHTQESNQTRILQHDCRTCGSSTNTSTVTKATSAASIPCDGSRRCCTSTTFSSRRSSPSGSVFSTRSADSPSP